MLQHVALEIRRADLDACRRFWELLGFVEVQPPATLRERASWMARADTQIHLLFDDSPVVPPAGHAAVVVEDYDVTLQRLREHGHRPEPRAEHWGAPRAFVLEPAGHRVELMSAAPSSAQP